jgi:hypothetical protein
VMRISCNVLVGKAKGSRLFERPKRRWDENILNRILTKYDVRIIEDSGVVSNTVKNIYCISDCHDGQYEV